jgi:hypothetical protein
MVATPLDDLQLSPEELERERAYQRNGNGKRRGENGYGPPTLPARCTCAHPWPEEDDDGASHCGRCGKWIGQAATPALLSALQPADEPAEGEVPWSARDERELRELVAAKVEHPWRLGDRLLEALPMGKTKAVNGAFKLLEELGNRIGLKASTVRRYRSVAYAWPPQHRIEGASYGAHVAHTRGGRRAAHQRAVVLRRLAADGLVTADAVKKARRLTRDPRRARDPLRNVVHRIDRASDYLAGELEALEPSPFLGRDALLAAADKARAIGDALEVAADGADRSRLAAIAPRLC